MERNYSIAEILKKKNLYNVFNRLVLYLVSSTSSMKLYMWVNLRVPDRFSAVWILAILSDRPAGKKSKSSDKKVSH